MSTPPGQLTEPAAEAVQRCAHELLPRSGEIAAEITAQVVAKLPRLVGPGSGSEQGVDAVRESTDQNIGAILSTLAFGVPATATEPVLGARKLLRHTVNSGGGITDLLRAYHYGHELIWQRWSSYVCGQLDDAEQLAEVLAMSSKHMFTFIDRSCEHLVAEYRSTYDGVGRGARAPGEVIRELVGDGSVDEGQASSVLGYDVRGHHLAVVLSPVAAAGSNGGVYTALDALAARAGGGGPDAGAGGGGAGPGARAATVHLPVGDGTVWAWFSWPAAPDAERLADVARTPLDGVLAATGRPGRGRTGFRLSHHQAREADRTARLSRRPATGVVGYGDLELAGLLCTDPERARPFAADRLGALGARDETCARLRETVLAYLEQGCSRTRTAAELHVHHKTVSYRLAQAEQLLGRPLTDDLPALGAALLIDRTLHGDPTADP